MDSNEKEYRKSIENIDERYKDKDDINSRYDRQDLIVSVANDHRKRFEYLKERKQALIDKKFDSGVYYNKKAVNNSDHTYDFNSDMDIMDNFQADYGPYDYSDDVKKLNELKKEKEMADKKSFTDRPKTIDKLEDEFKEQTHEPYEPKDIPSKPSQETKDFITKTMNLGQSYEQRYKDYSDKLKSMNKGELENFYKEKDAFDKGYYSVWQKERAERRAQLEYIQNLEKAYGQQDSLEKRTTYLKSIQSNKEGQQARKDIKNNSFIMGAEKK
jgi:hypothetical protein